jgi:hypothetical protein
MLLSLKCSRAKVKILIRLQMYFVQKKYCLLQKRPFKIIETRANKATQNDVFSGRRIGPAERVNITGTDQPRKALFKKKNR